MLRGMITEGEATMRAIGYVRVSTDEQAASGLGLEDQRGRLTLEAERRGWELELYTDEGYSAKNLDRPAIRQALELLAAGEADALVVLKLDRLSRSLLDFAALMERARAEGWALIALDLGVDTSTPAGEMMANVMASFAQYERRLIAQRTTDALAVKRRQGVRLGRPVTLDREVRDRIATEAAAGQSLAGIARSLNTDQVPTARGGRSWYASTVASVLRSLELDKGVAA